ncbi:hypothetical protein AVEN_215188-1 [Araneus ventricosus]|uniref:Uncharacterized protein n=1 Tax=Araneus ventricosus TaxID=182803 RepID=A0A4Y2LNR1_ARAVE|nr:hypothetical protein AVEN_256489-1 [Araneus ventricosus]GBN16143.1 hypothetical protein AVEN_215188-1 [Araneus ventricosus]
MIDFGDMSGVALANGNLFYASPNIKRCGRHTSEGVEETKVGILSCARGIVQKAVIIASSSRKLEVEETKAKKDETSNADSKGAKTKPRGLYKREETKKEEEMIHCTKCRVQTS